MLKTKKIVIFDLDDTLITSDAKIKVFDSENNELLSSLSPSQFNYHVRNKDHYFCFGDFECEKILGRAKLFPSTYRSFKRYYDMGVDLSIVTARSDKKMILEFFDSKNVKLKPSLVYTIHSPKCNFTGSISERKKQAIQDLISKGYNDIVFYEDNLENLKAAEELSSDRIKIKTIHVVHD
jgi:hydroxymethylpyrimidine pyrophosphatase-like HAD family hydrolase